MDLSEQTMDPKERLRLLRLDQQWKSEKARDVKSAPAQASPSRDAKPLPHADWGTW